MVTFVHLFVTGLTQEAAETTERNPSGVVVGLSAALSPEWPWSDGGVGTVFAAFVVSRENALISRNPLRDVACLCIS